jgi:hypothetical protein
MLLRVWWTARDELLYQFLQYRDAKAVFKHPFSSPRSWLTDECDNRPAVVGR